MSRRFSGWVYLGLVPLRQSVGSRIQEPQLVELAQISLGCYSLPAMAWSARRAIALQKNGISSAGVRMGPEPSARGRCVRYFGARRRVYLATRKHTPCEIGEIIFQRKVEKHGVLVFDHDLPFICRQEPWYASRMEKCVPLVTEVRRSAT